MTSFCQVSALVGSGPSPVDQSPALQGTGWDPRKGHSLFPLDLLTLMTGAWSSAAMLSLPHFRERRRHPEEEQRGGQGGGSSGATLLRADSSSQVPVITDKVMSRKQTPLNSNLIIASHMDIKASQRAAAMCAGGEIGIFRH